MTPSEFRAARKRLGMTVEARAEALGVTPRALNYYATGQRPIPGTIPLALEALEARAQKDG